MIDAPIKKSASNRGKLQSAVPDIPGLVVSTSGFKPITTLREFVAGLPEFGDDAVGLYKAIAELRAERRAEARERED